MSYDFNGLRRVTFEGYEPEHKLLIQTSLEWFNRGDNWTIPVRDVAVLFIPWEQRMQPETYKMLRFMHVFDPVHWSRYIDIWLNILGQRGLETVDIRVERVRQPFTPQWSRFPTGHEAMMETCRVEQCFIIHKQSSKYKFDPNERRGLSHASQYSWDTEAQQKQSDIARVYQALTEAAKLDFYEDLKRWHTEQYQYHDR